MSIIIDIIVIAIIALCVFLGYKKGLTGVLFKIVSFIVAIVMSLFLYKPLANFIINKTIIDDIIAGGIAQNITINDNQEIKEIKGEENLPDVISRYMNDTIGKFAKDNLDNVAQSVGEQIATIIIEIASLIIIYIVLKLILLIVKIFTDAFANLPVIKQCDKIRRHCLWHFRKFSYYIHYSCGYINFLTYDK